MSRQIIEPADEPRYTEADLDRALAARDEKCARERRLERIRTSIHCAKLAGRDLGEFRRQVVIALGWIVDEIEREAGRS